MAELAREEFYRAIDEVKAAMRDGFDGTHQRLDDLNGRTRTNEVDIGVLKDRGNRDTAARSLGASSLLSSAGALLWNLFTK